MLWYIYSGDESENGDGIESERRLSTDNEYVSLRKRQARTRVSNFDHKYEM